MNFFLTTDTTDTTDTTIWKPGLSEHFNRGNSDSDYIPRVRRQYEINLKPRHMRDELSHRFLLVFYLIIY